MARDTVESAEHPLEPRWRAWLAKRRALIVVGLLAAFFLQVVLSARLMSVTVDEFAHLPAGYIYWDKGDFGVYHQNPPLIKMWAALPLLRSGLDKKFTDEQNLWVVGRDFMYRNEPMYHTLYMRCRIMIALLGTALGYLVFRWSRELFGVAGGVLSLAVYAFSPNLIAHSGLVTTDLGAAAMYALACYALFKLDEKWSAWRLAFVGLAFGLAMITKLSCLALVPLAPLVLLLGVFPSRGEPDRARRTRKALVRGAATLGVIAVSCVLIINAGYGFKGSFKPWRSFEEEPWKPLASVAASAIRGLPAPFPEHFLRGLGEQERAAVAPQFQYLFGSISHRGWWYYYLAAFLLKVPVPILLLLVLAAYAGVRRFDRRVFVFIVVPAVFFFALFSLGTRINIGFRYQLPVLPLIFVSFGVLLRKEAPAPVARPACRAVMGALVVWLVVGSATTFPHYLAYFNEFAGGHGERCLVDSNCDWGQDHITLRRFMRREGIERVHLATFGRVDAAVYGVEYDTLRPNEPVTGDVVISINLYSGLSFMTPDNGRDPIVARSGAYAWLREHKPVHRIGGSLYYFRIEPEQGEQHGTGS